MGAQDLTAAQPKREYIASLWLWVTGDDRLLPKPLPFL